MELPFVEPAPLALPAESLSLVVAEPALVGPNVGAVIPDSELSKWVVALARRTAFCFCGGLDGTLS